MGIVNYGVVGNLAPVNNAALESRVIPYTWNSSFGYEIKQDSITFPLFSGVTKIVSNFPVRFRLYQNLYQQSLDASRPPWVLADTQAKPLVDVLVGQGVEKGRVLNPIALIVDVAPVPATLEKLLPDPVTINLLIYLVG